MLTQMLNRNRIFIAALALLISAPAVNAQSTSFTYQGKLSDGGNPANSPYDMQFKLYDTVTAGTGTQHGSTITVATPPVQVVNGAFTVQLDFAPCATCFDGTTRYLEIGVRPAGSADPYTVLAPRQPITSTPYAIRSLAATAADGLSVACVNCISSSQIQGIPAGSGNYIQNTTTQQTGTNFNISGNGLFGGNVGIGTTSPVAHLHVANASDSGAGLIVEATEGDRAAMYYNPNTGLVFDSFRPGDGRRLPLLLQPSGGNVGIGTTNPATKLEVRNFGYGITHSDGTISLSTYLGSGAAWFVTSNHPLYFYTNGSTRMAIGDTGNVAIGASTAGHRLGIFGGPSWTSNFWGGALELSNAAAIGWRANAAGQRFGIGQSTGGLYFFRTSSDPGTTGSPANYNLLLSDIGSVIVAPGATPPTAGVAFEVNGSARVAPGNGGAISFGAPNGETGMTIQHVIGSTRADVRFDGTVLKIVAGGPGGPPPSTNGISITTAGNVAIGSATPTQIGGWLHVNGGSFNGIYGNSNVFGVRGESTGNLGVGVYGNSSASNGYGLYGISSGSVGFGIYAKGLRYGGYFDGNVHIVGNLTGPTSSVKIDHPLDAANKYLYHSSVESPDMMNIYSGKVTTDESGEATIKLPDYFEALNRDFRYQLTVIGQFAQAIVLSEISNNRFTIQTDKPQVKVSWQVTGIRQDAYANANRIRDEEDKPEKERGYYLHPELFNQPEEKGVEWAHNPEMMRRNKEEREKTKKDTPSQP